MQSKVLARVSSALLALAAAQAGAQQIPVEDFAKEVAEHEHSDPLKPHQMTKVIGEVLAAIES